MSDVCSFGIIPAAGQSHRMGQPKLLLPWNELTIIEHVIATWQESDVDAVILVARNDDQPLIDICRHTEVQLILPEAPPPDMKTSVQHALRHVRQTESPKSTDVWMLSPADLPNLSSSTINCLLEKHDTENQRVIIPKIRDRRGHPVLIPWCYHDDVFRLAADEGINILMKHWPILELPIGEEAQFEDIDTPADYLRLRGGKSTDKDCGPG